MAVVAVLIVLQNTAGALLCHFFGLPPLLGLALGSLPLTGGHGTSAAFAPLLEDMGISNALTVAIAAATYGLIAGNLIGNPVARKRIVSLHLTTSSSGFKNEEAKAELEKTRIFDKRWIQNEGPGPLLFYSWPLEQAPLSRTFQPDPPDHGLLCRLHDYRDPDPQYQ